MSDLRCFVGSAAAVGVPLPSGLCVITGCDQVKAVEVVGLMEVGGKPVTKHLRLCASHELAYLWWLARDGRGMGLLRAAVGFVHAQRGRRGVASPPDDSQDASGSPSHPKSPAPIQAGVDQGASPLGGEQ
jgi:hypothetical protein